jgi:RNA polymerase sigma-70 factor (ECF subfamily)
VNTEPQKGSLLAPLADAYEPSHADADRIFAKLQASLLVAPVAPAPASSLARPKVAARGGRNVLLRAASCVVLAVVGGAIVHTRDGGEAPALTAHAPLPSPPVVLPLQEEASRALEAVRATSAIPSLSVDALPRANAARATSSATAAASTPPLAVDTLAREARLLADARRAVQRGDDQGALALLDEHARVFPNGWLANDRAVEHVVVLCNMGRRADAVHEARTFLDGRPESPLTRRVATSCAGQP